MIAGVVLSLVLAQTVVMDRIAATIDREIITLSEVMQVIAIRLIPQTPGEPETDYRRRVLESLIAQALRYRDVQRFGGDDVSPDAVEARLRDVRARFESPQEFEEALRAAELTVEDVRSLVRRQLQVESYIQEGFAPLVFVSIEEVETYYQETWLPQRAQRGLPAQPLDQVSEEIRTVLRARRLQDEIEVWTQQLRGRANVDVFVYR
jgi:hypothetical protein